MRFIRAITLVILAALAASSGKTAAQQMLTLDDAIELALKNRAAIIAARGSERVAGWDRVVALGQFLPRIDASYRYAKSKDTDQETEADVPTAFDTVSWEGTSNGDPITITTLEPTAFESRTIQLEDDESTSKNLSIDASMSLLNVSNWFELAAAGAAKAREHLNVIASEQDMVLSVKASYYLYLAAVERIETDEEAVKRSEEQLKLIESKYELGSASRSDVLKQRVRLGNDRLALLEGANLVTTTRADLAYTIGIDPRSNTEFSTEYVIRDFDGTLDNAIEFSLEHNPSLLSARKDVDVARHSVKARWADYLPTLGGFASYSIFDGTRGDTLTYDFSSRSRTYGISLNWNIFDGFFRERNLVAAKVSRNIAEADAAERQNLTIARVQSAYLEIQRLVEQRQVARENVAAAQEDLNITQEKYNLGAATILDLLDAQVSIKEAQVALIRAEFDYNLAVARLENAMGAM